jgi:fructose-specific phosphotransferase system IIC component
MLTALYIIGALLGWFLVGYIHVILLRFLPKQHYLRPSSITGIYEVIVLGLFGPVIYISILILEFICYICVSLHNHLKKLAD